MYNTQTVKVCKWLNDHFNIAGMEMGIATMESQYSKAPASMRKSGQWRRLMALLYAVQPIFRETDTHLLNRGVVSMDYSTVKSALSIHFHFGDWMVSASISDTDCSEEGNRYDYIRMKLNLQDTLEILVYQNIDDLLSTGYYKVECVNGGNVILKAAEKLQQNIYVTISDDPKREGNTSALVEVNHISEGEV